MKQRTLFAAILALGLVVAAPFAFAQHDHMRGPGQMGAGMMHGDMGGGMLLGHLAHAQQALGLSDAQVTQIKGIFSDLKTQNAPYRGAMRSGMHSVMQALIANPNDLAGAQALIDQQTAAERTMKTNALNAAAKALNVLTPEQRAKLGTLLQERMARHSAK